MNSVMPDITSDAVKAKVAAALGITVQKLTDALTQAEAQLKVDNFNKMLDKAVADKKITQAEEDQIKGWWAQKPAAADKVMPGLGAVGQSPMNKIGGQGMMGGRFGGGINKFQPRVPGIKAQ